MGRVSKRGDNATRRNVMAFVHPVMTSGQHFFRTLPTVRKHKARRIRLL
jgi:hypothetical protein